MKNPQKYPGDVGKVKIVKRSSCEVDQWGVAIGYILLSESKRVFERFRGKKL